MGARPAKQATPCIAAIVSAIACLLIPGRLQPGTTIVHAKEGSPSVVYLLDSTSSTQMQSLRPDTLATMSGASVSLSHKPTGKVDRRLLASGDGSTLAVISVRDVSNAPPTTGDITIQVYDLVHHVRHRAYHPPVAIEPWSMGISTDGKQLFGQVLGRAGYSVGWAVLNAATGKARQKLSFVRDCCSTSLYDPVRRRLYLLDDSSGSGSAPSAAALTVYDVAKRQLVGHLELPGVWSGMLNTGRTMNEQPVMAIWMPGLALSPDGNRIAVVAPNSDALLLIDTQRLAIARTESVKEPDSLLSRLARWLEIAPPTAWAKEMEGVALNASFSSDGSRLFVTGMQSTAAGNSFAWHGLGLRTIDVADGHVAAQSLAGDGVQLIQSPMGDPDLYTLSPSHVSPEDSICPCTLRRLDGGTLNPAAERSFTALPALVVADPWSSPGGSNTQ